MVEVIRVWDGRPTRIRNAWGDLEPYGKPDRAMLGRMTIARGPFAFLDAHTRREMLDECAITRAIPPALTLREAGAKIRECGISSPCSLPAASLRSPATTT